MNFYKSTRWKHKRTRILKRDEYCCRQCKRYGKNRTATTVHHINPLETHSELRLESWNLLSLCSKCHDAMHDRINNTLTPLGMEWVVRVSPHL